VLVRDILEIGLNRNRESFSPSFSVERVRLVLLEIGRRLRFHLVSLERVR